MASGPMPVAAAAVVSDDALLRVHAALKRLTLQQYRAAQQELCVYPVKMHGLRHPCDGGPISGMHQRVLKILSLAAGEGLEVAGAWLRPRVGAACSVDRLEEMLGRCVPDDAAPALVVALVRRLLTDALRLLVRADGDHVAVSDAAERFRSLAENCADDVGLIDEDALRAAVAAEGWRSSYEALVRACGLERVRGWLVTRSNRYTAVKVALLEMGRAASVREIAEATGCGEASVAVSFSVCMSIVRTGPGRWAVDSPDGALSAFVAAVERCIDDADLIDEQALAEAAASDGFAGRVEDLTEAAGMVRLFGRLAVADTAAAAAKALLLQRGAPVPLAAIGEATGRPLSTLRQALWRCPSTALDTEGKWAVTTSAAHAARSGDPASGDGGLGTFLGIVESCADDAGIVDEQALADAAAEAGVAGRVEEFAEAAGMVRLFGSLALSANTMSVSKAALLSFDGPASVADVAKRSERTAKSVQHAFSDCPSIVRVGHSAWAVDRDGMLAVFAADAHACADDAGLIDESALATAAEAGSYAARVDELTEAAGMVRLFGRLAVSETAAAIVTAALLGMDRPATIAEIAQRTKLRSERVSTVLSLSRSLTQAGHDRWVAAGAGGGVYEQFAEAVMGCSDDVGLIDEDALKAAAAAGGFAGRVDELAEVCGLVRVSGWMAGRKNAATSVKAAMLGLGRPVQLDEIVKATGYSYSAVQHVLSRCESITRVRYGYWEASSRG